VLVLVLVLVLGSPARAADIPDYDPRSTAWNGLSNFVALAEGMGFEVTPVARLEWSDLTANDILVLMYPLQRVDPSRLSAFVQAGGNVVIADDYGESKDALAALGLIVDIGAPHATRYYKDHLFAPIATAQTDHPLTAAVGDVVTNHPAAFKRVSGATRVIGFEDGALVVAGERGPGKFVAVSDPSIFINQMQREPFAGNVQLAANLLRYLNRDGRARHVVLVRGDVPMYGDPRPFIDDPRGGKIARSVDGLNDWLRAREEWLLTPAAMKGLAAALAALLLLLAVFALPVRRGPRIDGAWLRFGRPARRDEPHGLVALADRGGPTSRTSGGSLLVVACVLRDQVQNLLEEAIGRPEPLHTMSEAELVAQVATARGPLASAALSRVYRRLRALPSRSQAAAPWSAGQMPRRDFDTLYRDVAELCRTLGAELSEASP
jgi:hypothetical protein